MIKKSLISFFIITLPALAISQEARGNMINSKDPSPRQMEIGQLFEQAIKMHEEKIRQVKSMMPSSCGQAPRPIIKYSCRTSMNQPYRREFDQPSGYDCVTIEKPNPRTADFEFCTLKRANREDEIKIHQEAIKEIEKKFASAMADIDSMDESRWSSYKNEIKKIASGD